MTRPPARLRARTLWGAGALALTIVLGLGALGALGGVERAAIDARFEARGTQPVSGVAVIGIDERTFSTMDVTWPIRRQLHADAIDQLRRSGVKTIAYDVQFTERSTSEDDDLALFDAVARAPGTILATGESTARGGTRVLGGDDQLAEIGARAANSTFPSDSGGTIRRYTRDNAQLTSLAVAAAAASGRPLRPDAFSADGTALIDYRGPARTIPTYSFVDLVKGRIPASKLRGRVVVVGATAPVLQDIHPTSAAGSRLMPGPEIQANAIWTAMHGNPLRDAPGWFAWLLATAFGVLGTWLVVRFGALKAHALAALMLVALSAASMAAFSGGVVLAVALPALALLATVAVTSLAAVAGEMALRLHLTRYSEQLERDVAARTADLESSQLEMVIRLARAAELRDDDTGEHIDRMSALCGEVARELGFSERDADRLRHASALHDIGKIGVPDAVLLKPSRLSEVEFEVMRRHVVNGAGLLHGSASPVIQLAEEVARTHHERWDGAGYPAGLSGEAIPLAGRIAAVCDVFDALTNERPYKRAWSLAEACAEIVRGKGSHFDPAVADALLAIVARRDAVDGDGLRQPRLGAASHTLLARTRA